MKKLAKKLVAATILPFVDFIALHLWKSRQIWDRSLRPGVFYESVRRAVMDAVDYADAHMQRALCFEDSDKVRAHAFIARSSPGLVVEFGVWRGNSITYFASQTKETVFGFDSFEGLREDWTGGELRKGTFDLGGELPSVPANVKLIKGWFNETLPGFLQEHPEPFSFVHIDCDTYEGAASVFQVAGNRIGRGTVILFDEYFGYRGWRMGEFKAWQEFIALRGLTYKYLAFSDQAASVVVT
jgi:hypothetical protein